ncbi:MAG: hypothetical protein ACTS8H_03465 [Arsenophonus sp. NC-PE1-MAG3]
MIIGVINFYTDEYAVLVQWQVIQNINDSWIDVWLMYNENIKNIIGYQPNYS